MSNKNWLITGVSGGLGRALAEKVLKEGEFVIATFRKQVQADAFTQQYGVQKVKAFVLDITDYTKVDKMIEELENSQIPIDVLVNNAGYGMLGAVEEVSMEEAKAQMEVNVFGVLYLTQKILPIMRAQNTGRILQISSSAGFHATTGMGIYNASKFALEGFSEALAFDLEGSNIKVSIIAPGPFRTEFGGSSLKVAKKKITGVYDHTAHRLIDTIQQNSGTQEGDPAKAAEVIYTVANAPNPPLHLPLGPHAIERFESKMKNIQQEINDWKHISSRTNFNE